MKKRIVILFLFPSLIILPCCGGQGQAFLWDASSVKYDVTGSKTFGFNITLATKNKNDKNEFLQCFGENVTGLAVTFQDDTFEKLKGKKYNGYDTRLLGFQCDTENDYVCIEGVSLSLNGETIQINFATPLEHHVAETMDADEVICTFAPTYISTHTYTETDYTYSFNIEEPITIQSFSFHAFLQFQNIKILVNETEIGDFSTPVHLKKGDQVKLEERYHPTAEIEIDAYDNIYCNAVLTYIKEETEGKTLQLPLVSMGISNEEDAAAAMSILVSQQ